MFYSKEQLPEPKYRVIWLDQNGGAVDENGGKTAGNGGKTDRNGGKTDRNGGLSVVYCQQNPFLGRVVDCSRFTPDQHFQDVR